MIIWRGWGVLIVFGTAAGIALGTLVIADLLPIESQVAAKAVCFHEAMQPAFHDYTEQIVANAAAMATRSPSGDNSCTMSWL